MDIKVNTMALFHVFLHAHLNTTALPTVFGNKGRWRHLVTRDSPLYENARQGNLDDEFGS